MLSSTFISSRLKCIQSWDIEFLDFKFSLKKHTDTDLLLKTLKLQLEENFIQMKYLKNIDKCLQKSKNDRNSNKLLN